MDVMGSGLQRTRGTVRRSLILLAGMLGLVSGVTVPAATAVSPTHRAPVASAARSVQLKLSVNTYLVGRAGRTFNERGRVSGSINGTVAGHFVSIESTRGRAEFIIYDSHGGSLTCVVITHGQVVGAIVHGEGTLSIVKGTGRWAHARSTSIRYTGTVDRRNFRGAGQMLGSVSV